MLIEIFHVVNTCKLEKQIYRQVPQRFADVS